MLTEDEVAQVINHLSERHTWYMDNLPDPASRFHGICSEVGVSDDDVQSIVEFIIMQHAKVPAQFVPGYVIQSVCHAIWAGVELGKRIGEVIRSD